MAEKTIETKSNLPVQSDGSALQATREPDRYLVPAVDIYETPDGLVLVADVPGVTKAGLDVRVDEDLLTIKGKVGHEVHETPWMREFELADYWRQFELSDAVDASKIDAVLKNGVLTLTLPKAEKAKPKQIAVKVG